MSAFLIGPKIGVVDFQADGSLYGDDIRHVLRMLQVLVEPNVISLGLNTPPGAPNNGDTYIVAAGGTGVWLGQDQNIAYWTTDNPKNPGGDGEFYTPLKGWLASNQADGNLYKYTGSVWAVFGSGGVTNIATAGIATGGPITGTGTITVAGSGDVAVAATADPNLATAPIGDVVITDGFGNVEDSGVLLSSLGGSIGVAGQVGFWGPGLLSTWGLEVTGGSVSVVANQVTVFQFVLDSPWVLRSATIWVEDNNATTVTFGFYSLVGNKLLDSGPISLASLGISGTTFGAVTLPAKTPIYFAQAGSNTINVMRAFALASPTEMEPILNQVSRSPVIAQAANPMVAGVLPATLGPLTRDVSQFDAAAVYWAP
jgi:Protein of unknown function (DUF2793)